MGIKWTNVSNFVRHADPRGGAEDRGIEAVVTYIKSHLVNYLAAFVTNLQKNKEKETKENKTR